MCMLEIGLIMVEKTNSNDKEKIIIYLFYCRNNSAVSVLSPRGPDSCLLTFYNRNYMYLANSAPLSDVFRLLLSHGLTIVTWFCMMTVVLSQRSDVVNPARSLMIMAKSHVIRSKWRRHCPKWRRPYGEL